MPDSTGRVGVVKLGCLISTPDVAEGPLALLTGTFGAKLKKARMLGFDGVELMVRDVSRLSAAEIGHALREQGLGAPQIVTGELFGTDGLALVHPDPAVCGVALHRVQEIIQLAGALGPGTMVNIGRVRGRLDWLEAGVVAARRNAIQVFRTLADFAESCNVRIALEPCNRYEVDFVHTTRDALEVVAEVERPNFGLMLDLFHMNIEDPSIEGAFDEARETLWHVHVADSNRLAPGQGHLDFPKIISALHEAGYDGYLSAELLPLPDPDTAARLTAEYLSRCVGRERRKD